MSRYVTWEAAHDAAQALANRYGLDVAIRRVREHGRDGYNVTFSAHTDAPAEVVKPKPKLRRVP